MTGPLGLYGGTFDPIHFGHLRLATELAEAFHLERVLFLPAGLPYHRGREAHATSEQRLTMVKLAIGRDARFDVPGAISKEVRVETVFRYANVFDRALELIASGKVDLKPLITGTYAFDESVAAFERAAEARPTDVKLQIRVQGEN